ncbi:MAG: hypothetical protein HRU19_16880 [Pseudobacteriovorax sp.]|nr:hypothetical protein [Pseudobacteriovorax sp.]
MKQGYEIQNLTDDSFNTDYKRDPKSNVKSVLGNTLYSYDIKFVVVAEESNRISFTLRAKQTKYGSDLGRSCLDGNDDRRSNLGEVVGQTEVPVSYNEQNKQWHIDMKRQVCES